MDIGVLGPCRVTQAGISVVPTAIKPRKLLALLALHPDRVVSVAALIEELWGGHPPRSVQTTLQTYILQIRNMINAALAGSSQEGLPWGAKSVLVTKAGGYLLDTQGGMMDALEADRLAGAGHRFLEAGDHAAAAARFRQALALWRGPTLVDVQVGPLLEVEVMRLEECRMSILGQRIEADLNLGRHHEILGELAGLAVQYPTYERLQAQLMLALYRSGRRGSALETYHRLRTTLSRELGLDPSPGIQELQRAMLCDDPELEREAAGVGPLRMLRAG
ncbi:AfsR/SARP family transcriptional regulator [Streptacidiphilus sp. PB12-B1b]|uniref:AfsR/SARP family transcriptional regulator n=1 Tax=Streptacidiphilus sp. PB12-B1b TaxID=2705012 RepID=UPI0015FDB9A7|nr:AfsR/SARP family transcriptional regulator [Streptacidiphilus sp. PB12-B1b]QMU78130.1 AfsR/SARP family transcriptional regulator [Streptacidiphilus sp. PB12-B1b]